MNDIRPDLVFVVSGAVWRDFVLVRDRNGDAISNGFYLDCQQRVAHALQQADAHAIGHWEAVRRLGELYGPCWASAVEVDGVLIREAERSPGLRYPPDHQLERIVIAADCDDPVEQG